MPWAKCVFDEHGQNPYADPVLIQYVDKKWVTVFPQAVAVADAIWPMSA
jgi:branched-chain amino acid transport system substrate-binding protein